MSAASSAVSSLAVLAVVASRFQGDEFVLPGRADATVRRALFDVAFTFVRRLLSGERITQAHRGHLYQVAARAGISRLGGRPAPLPDLTRSGARSHWRSSRHPGRRNHGFRRSRLLPQFIWLACARRAPCQAGLGQW